MPKFTVSELNIKLVASSQGLAVTLNNANRQLTRFSQNAQRNNQGLAGSFQEFEKILARTIALYAAFNAIGAVKNQLIDSVRLAADAEQAEIAFEVLLGSAEDAKNTLQSLYDFVETTPFRLEETRDAAKLLAAFGIENKKILPTLRALGDLAAGTGNSILDLADLYGKTNVEQRLYTRDLNQFVSRGIDLISVFSEQFGRPKNEIRKLAEEGRLSFGDVERAIASMTSEGGRFFGLTQRQAQTTGGEFSNFLDEVDALKREFGAGLLPVLRDFLSVMREMVTGSESADERIAKLRKTGKELGEVLRVTAGGFNLVRLGLIELEIAAIKGAVNFKTVGGVLHDTFETKFLRAWAEELRGQADGISKSTLRLFDLTKPLYDRKAIEAPTGADSLANFLGEASNAAIRAQNDLKALKQDAEAFVTDLEKNYASPLEKFELAIRKITQANLFGGLDDEFATRAIAEEVENLRKQTEKLRDVLKTNPAAVKGTQEDILARFQQKFGRDNINGQPTDNASIQKLIDSIRNQLSENAAELEAAANPATESLGDLSGAADQATSTLENLYDKLLGLDVDELAAGIKQTGRQLEIFTELRSKSPGGPSAPKLDREALAAVNEFGGLEGAFGQVKKIKEEIEAYSEALREVEKIDVSLGGFTGFVREIKGGFFDSLGLDPPQSVKRDRQELESNRQIADVAFDRKEELQAQLKLLEKQIQRFTGVQMSMQEAGKRAGEEFANRISYVKTPAQVQAEEDRALARLKSEDRGFMGNLPPGNKTTLDTELRLNRLRGAARGLESGDTSGTEFLRRFKREITGTDTSALDALKEVAQGVRAKLTEGQQTGLERILQMQERRLERTTRDEDKDRPEPKFSTPKEDLAELEKRLELLRKGVPNAASSFGYASKKALLSSDLSSQQVRDDVNAIIEEGLRISNPSQQNVIARDIIGYDKEKRERGLPDPTERETESVRDPSKDSSKDPTKEVAGLRDDNEKQAAASQAILKSIAGGINRLSRRNPITVTEYSA